MRYEVERLRLVDMSTQIDHTRRLQIMVAVNISM